MTDPVPYHMFVYGSLRSDFGSSAHSYMQRYFRLVGKAKVRGSLFDLGPYPAAAPSLEDAYIIGELYAIADISSLTQALAELDDYEGVQGALYRRELTEAIYGTNRITTWIYWYNGDLSGKTRVMSGDIVVYLKSKSTDA